MNIIFVRQKNKLIKHGTFPNRIEKKKLKQVQEVQLLKVNKTHLEFLLHHTIKKSKKGHHISRSG